MTKKYQGEVFSSPTEYVDFARKYKVFGADAIALKKKMMIPLPDIKKERRKRKLK